MFDPKLYFEALRGPMGRLSRSQVSGMEFLVGSMEDDIAVYNVKYAAYMMATVQHETGRKFQPIREWGSDSYLDQYDTGKKAKALGNTPEDDDDGILYCGRGYSMLTGAANYAKFGKALGIPLLDHPDMALDPAAAYRILSLGMTAGMFTGKKLADYFAFGRENPVEARRIVNGMDRAARIADLYRVQKNALEEGGFRQ